MRAVSLTLLLPGRNTLLIKTVLQVAPCLHRIMLAGLRLDERIDVRLLAPTVQLPVHVKELGMRGKQHIAWQTLYPCNATHEAIDPAWSCCISSKPESGSGHS